MKAQEAQQVSFRVVRVVEARLRDSVCVVSCKVQHFLLCQVNNVVLPQVEMFVQRHWLHGAGALGQRACSFYLKRHPHAGPIVRLATSNPSSVVPLEDSQRRLWCRRVTKCGKAAWFKLRNRGVNTQHRNSASEPTCRNKAHLLPSSMCLP